MSRIRILATCFLAAVLLAGGGCSTNERIPADAPLTEVAGARPLPALTGRVVDEAEVLTPDQEAALVAKLAALEASTGHQFVVITVKTLGPERIEQFGLRAGRTWGIGRKGVNDGVILLVAPTERKVRIEVGYGLEGVLRDDICAKILRIDVLPAFKRGDFPGGIQAGVDAVIAKLMAAQPYHPTRD